MQLQIRSMLFAINPAWGAVLCVYGCVRLCVCASVCVYVFLGGLFTIDPKYISLRLLSTWLSLTSDINPCIRWTNKVFRIWNPQPVVSELNHIPKLNNQPKVTKEFELYCCCHNHHIIIGFLINIQVQGQHPHQWANFQIAGLLHAWQISHQISRYVYHEGW